MSITFTVKNTDETTQDITIEQDHFNEYADDGEGATDQLSKSEFDDLLVTEFTDLGSSERTAIVDSVFGDDGVSEFGDIYFDTLERYIGGATIDVETSSVSGDANGDGEIDGDEVAGDTNGVVDENDEVAGDTNGDGIVDENDETPDTSETSDVSTFQDEAIYLNTETMQDVTVPVAFGLEEEQTVTVNLESEDHISVLETEFGLDSDDIEALKILGTELSNSQFSAIMSLRDITAMSVDEIVLDDYNKTEFEGIVGTDPFAFGTDETVNEGNDYGRAANESALRADLFFRMMGTSADERYPMLAGYNGNTAGTLYGEQVKT